MKLRGKKIVVLVADGFEDLEYWVTVMRLQEEGAEVISVGPNEGSCSGKNALEATADVTADQVDASELDGIVVPGGWAPDKLRRYEEITGLVRAVHERGKTVGIICHGAGLVMSTLDVVAYAGENFGGVKPANFLDIGGGASAQVMADGLEVVLSDPSVKSVFVNVFGGITACDEVANGIIQALALLGERGEAVTKPLVVRLDGNNAEAGRAILDEAKNPLVERVDTMDGAAERAAELAAAGK